MPAVLLDSQGRVLTNGTGPYVVDDVFVPPRYTGTVDREGLTALGWDTNDINWLQQNVWWDKEDNDYWKVSEANLAFGPNGTTPLTWANRATIKENPEVKFFPKFTQAPNSNTSWSQVFDGYKYIYAIPTHGWDTTKVTSLSYAFRNCYNLRSIGDISGWVVSSVTSLAYAFMYCYNLRNVGSLANWNIGNVTSLYQTFYCCQCLFGIGDLSNWNTAKITTMYQTFYNCTLFCDIGNLSNWNVSNVTSFGGMFQGCTNLKRICGVANWNVEKVTSFAAMFYACANLQYIDDLTNWNTLKVTNTSSMFYCCYSLKRIGNLSNWKMGLVTNIYYMFNGCYLLTDIGDLSNWDVSKVNGTSTSTGFIGVFNACYALKRLGDLTNWTLNLSGEKNQMNSLFSGCMSLSSLNVKNWDVSAVINFTYTFSSNRGLEELDISGWDLSANANSGTSAATSIFANLPSLKKLVLGPNFFSSSTVVTYYFDHLYSWVPDSVVESLYTNQTSRTSESTLITIRIPSSLFTKLNNNLPEGFTYVDSTHLKIVSKNIELLKV